MLFKDVRLFPDLKNKKLFQMVVKMMVARGLLKEKDVDKYVETLSKNYDKFTQSSTVDGLVTVVIISGKLASIGKAGGLTSALNNSSVPLKLVIVDSIQTNARKSILQFQNTEVFTTVEMLSDPYNHVLVPKHRLLTPDEKEKLLKFISVSQLPRLESSDIIARYLGLNAWDVVAIERVSPTTGLATYYRIVIPAAN